MSAAADIEKAIQIDPKFRWSYSGRGKMYARMGEWQKALNGFREYHRLGPADSDILHRISLLTLATGDLEGYRSWCGELLKHSQQADDPQASLRLLESATLGPNAFKDMKQIVKLAEAKVAEKPNDLKALLRLGAAHFRAGDYSKALEQFLHFLKKHLCSLNRHSTPVERDCQTASWAKYA